MAVLRCELACRYVSHHREWLWLWLVKAPHPGALASNTESVAKSTRDHHHEIHLYLSRYRSRACFASVHHKQGVVRACECCDSHVPSYSVLPCGVLIKVCDSLTFLPVHVQIRSLSYCAALSRPSMSTMWVGRSKGNLYHFSQVAILRPCVESRSMEQPGTTCSLKAH